MANSRQYNYSVDGKPFQTTDSTLDGASIKARAGVGPTFGLFLEGRGQDPDRPIGDAERIDVSVPGHEKFYTAPPATFGRV